MSLQSEGFYIIMISHPLVTMPVRALLVMPKSIEMFVTSFFMVKTCSCLMNMDRQRSSSLDQGIHGCSTKGSDA